MNFPKPSKAALRPMALLIQGAMKQRNLSVRALTETMGLEARQIPAVYNWVGGKNGPSPEMRAKLAQVLGLTETQLTAPTKPGQHTKQLLGPAQRAVVLASAAGQTAATSVLVATEPVRDVFTIAGRSDGQIMVRLQTTLDAKRGMALARYLLDFGLIMGDHEGESEGAREH